MKRGTSVPLFFHLEISMIPAHLRKMEKIKFWCLLMMTFLFISLGTISCGNRENVQDKVSQEGPDSTKFQEMKEVEKLIRVGEFSKAKNQMIPLPIDFYVRTWG